MSGLDRKTKDLIKQALEKTQPFLTFFINHIPISPATKTIKAMYVQQQIQRPCLKNLKWHQQHFPRWQEMLQQPLLQVF